MATLQVKIQNGKFVSSNGVNVEVFTDKHITANGWIGYIDEKGNVDFFANRFYGGVRHKIKFEIVDGVVKKWLKVGDKPPKMLKVYKLEKWPDDGTIVISNGELNQRVAFFRTASFQKFLDEYQITAVRSEVANGIYYLLEEHNGYVLTFRETIETDGKYEILSRDVDLDETTVEKPFSIYETAEITDASWVIKTIWKLGKVKHRILYTLDEPQEIIGLPKLR